MRTHTLTFQREDKKHVEGMLNEMVAEVTEKNGHVLALEVRARVTVCVFPPVTTPSVT